MANKVLDGYKKKLEDSKNIIFHGAPGTGKTYLARNLAAYMVSDGKVKSFSKLNSEQRSNIEFVQFHPSYDYTDFVEGLRPKTDKNGNVRFELKDGIFKSFIDKVIENNASKALGPVKKALEEMKGQKFQNEANAKKPTEFYISEINDEKVKVVLYVNGVKSVKDIVLSIRNIVKMVMIGKTFDILDEVRNVLKTGSDQRNTYYRIYANKIIDQIPDDIYDNHVFIIDEINRGDFSKIIGELFYAIDPGNRGPAGAVTTQFANMHPDEDKFYIPDNVYIIGTMNDIDRSVVTFDFAVRRRFRFIEIDAESKYSKGMLDSLTNKNVALKKMEALNRTIVNTDGLNKKYQIGASYFLKLNSLNNSYDLLWKDYLEPLLEEYVNGMYNEEAILKRFKEAYDSGEASDED
ncbi:MAG: AAA family ATPase [Limosilactobacillus sp.]|uniref:McrB family protein n=1 Tax=Limosilactobacillus sp. TaxID=2773925 RepID=UPI002705458E|nr:AAA family ATPase [Limosilactobacillus sp.]